MPHISWKTTGLLLVLTTALVGGVHAQRQHEQHHPGGAQTPQQQPAETSPGVPAPPRRMQGMMENMQGMMQHMQGMMERMQGMMGRQGMGMTTQEEDDEEENAEEASPQRAMMGPRGMMGLGGMRGPGGMMARHMAAWRSSSSSPTNSGPRYGCSCAIMPRRSYASERISAC